MYKLEVRARDTNLNYWNTMVVESKVYKMSKEKKELKEQ